MRFSSSPTSTSFAYTINGVLVIEQNPHRDYSCGDCILSHLLLFPVDIRALVSYGYIYCMYTFLLWSD